MTFTLTEGYELVIVRAMSEAQAQDIDVAAIRSELGLSQAAFAEAMHVDQSTVSLWENKKNTPRGPSRQWMLKLLEDHRGRSAHVPPQDAAA